MFRKFMVAAVVLSSALSAHAQGEEVTYEVPVNDPALAPFATDIVTDADLRHVVKFDPRRPQRRKEFIKLDYTMPTTLVGTENMKIEMRGPVPAEGETAIALKSKQGVANCTLQEGGDYNCTMDYAKENLPIDAELAAAAIENSGLNAEGIIAKKAVQAAFAGEPIGILHGVKLKQQVR
jgi:hypothetical protein